MRLSRQLLSSPSAGHTLSSVTLGDTNGVKVVVLCEYVTDTDLLLEQASGKVDLGSAVATVDLELDDSEDDRIQAEGNRRAKGLVSAELTQAEVDTLLSKKRGGMYDTDED